MKFLPAWFLLALCVAGCPRSTLRPAAAPTQPIESLPAPTQHAPVDAPLIEPARTGWLERTTLEQFLDQGIARFLSTVELEAVFAAERFAGWRVLRHENPWVDVQVGDVIMAVNGRPIRTPDDLASLWRSLRHAGAIEVEINRGHERVDLRFAVAGQHRKRNPQLGRAPDVLP